MVKNLIINELQLKVAQVGQNICFVNMLNTTSFWGIWVLTSTMNNSKTYFSLRTFFCGSVDIYNTKVELPWIVLGEIDRYVSMHIGYYLLSHKQSNWVIQFVCTL